MKLAMYHNQPAGGAARSMYEFGRYLARRHDVDVYTLSTADEGFLDSHDFARKVRVFEYRRSSPVRLGFYLNEWRRNQDVSALEEISRDVAGAIDAEGYDAVLAGVCRFVETPSVLNYLTTPSAYFCQEPPRRFIEDVCRPDTMDFSAYQRFRRIVHRPAEAALDARLARLDRRNFAAARVVMASSAYIRDRALKYYGREASVCHLGVDAAKFTPAAARGDYLLSVGTIQTHKGFDFLLRALGLVDPGLRPRLVIAGDSANSALRAHLEALAGSLRLEVEFRVAIPPQRMPELYQGARAFVFGSHSEPFGLAPLEAMACGLPVVAVAEGGLLETVTEGETGLLTPRDEAAFAAAVTRLLQDDVLASRLGAAARRSVEGAWTWELSAARVERELEALTAKAAGAAASRGSH